MSVECWNVAKTCSNDSSCCTTKNTIFWILNLNSNKVIRCKKNSTISCHIKIEGFFPCGKFILGLNNFTFDFWCLKWSRRPIKSQSLFNYRPSITSWRLIEEQIWAFIAQIIDEWYPNAIKTVKFLSFSWRRFRRLSPLFLGCLIKIKHVS